MNRSRWTTADIPDLHGRTAIVTGANSGLGLESARALGRAGAHVVLACRNTVLGGQALAKLRHEQPTGSFELRRLNLADLSSVGAFSDEAADLGRLDLLLNNAGVMAPPRRQTVDGFELQFGTNHLGHFALTMRLLPLLVASGPGRVVTTSSIAHRIGSIAFDDLHSQRSYHRWPAYGQSKVANLLFTFELARRLDTAGLAVTALAAHPGYAATKLQASGPGMGRSLPDIVNAVGGQILNVAVAQSAARGALPQLRAATDPSATNGEYYGPGGVFEARGYPVPVGASAIARDEGIAGALWGVSEGLTGETWPAVLPA